MVVKYTLYDGYFVSASCYFLADFVLPNQEFEVLPTPLSDDDLHPIRENISSFIMDLVISMKGEFQCNNPAPNRT